MPSLIGLFLALVVATFARVSGFDRDRSFYPTLLIVIGSYYELFGAMSPTTGIIAWESLGLAGCVVLALLAFRCSAWFAVAGLLAHGLFDCFHGHLIENPGVPRWWPSFCLAYDLTAAVCLAGLTIRHPRPIAG